MIFGYPPWKWSFFRGRRLVDIIWMMTDRLGWLEVGVQVADARYATVYVHFFYIHCFYICHCIYHGDVWIDKFVRQFYEA